MLASVYEIATGARSWMRSSTFYHFNLHWHSWGHTDTYATTYSPYVFHSLRDASTASNVIFKLFTTHKQSKNLDSWKFSVVFLTAVTNSILRHISWLFCLLHSISCTSRVEILSHDEGSMPFFRNRKFFSMHFNHQQYPSKLRWW